MNRKKIILSCIALLLVGTSMFGEISLKGNASDIKFELGISGGMWLPGIIEQGKYDSEKETGFILRTMGDLYMNPYFALGFYTNLCPSVIDDYGASVVELGLALKPRIFLRQNLTVKPGLNIGYRSIGYDNSDMWLYNSDGLALNLSVETQYHRENGLIIACDTGFLAQPVGGNDRISTDFVPIFYIAAEIGIGVR